MKDVHVPDPREDKLPVWVREDLHALRHEIGRLTRSREAAQLLADNVRRATDPDTSRIVLEDPTNNSTENIVGIASTTTVLFRLDEPTPDYQGREIAITIDEKEGTIDVSTLDHHLIIEPVDWLKVRISSR